VTGEQPVAMDEARRAVEGRSIDQFVERLADRVGARASVAAIFGEPVVRGELTVVPIGRVRWGVGGGGGNAVGEGAFGSGSGGGGGVAADPVGYLEIGPAGATFQPIAEPCPRPLFLLASGIAAALVIRALARLIRG
jgi:uncharacterized spore protein YtfJ